MIHKELKRAILTWLLDNENEWQRINACTAHFRPYIFDGAGDYLIGGEIVAEFIKQAEKLIYCKNIMGGV